MRLSIAEKEEIIKLVERSEIGVNRTLAQLGINKSTFYKWYKSYLDKGSSGLEPKRTTRQRWNAIPQAEKNLVVEIALEYSELSPRELSCKLSDIKRNIYLRIKCVQDFKVKGINYQPIAYLAGSGK